MIGYFISSSESDKGGVILGFRTLRERLGFGANRVVFLS
jgi:hypothetical protein